MCFYATYKFNISKMIFLKILPICLYLVVRGTAEVDKALLCSSTYCADKTCPDPPEECKVQNSTFSGQWMPYPDFCNCCDYCLVHVVEGEECTQGSLGAPPTGTVCGPGLTCILEDEKGVCKRMKSECHSLQDEYEERRKEGLLGFLETRPVCDEEGRFGPVVCVPGQTCFCQSKDGEKIFGEAVNEKSVSIDMKCGCSRAAHFASKLLGSAKGRRCASDGSFDELQCVGRRCFCAFREGGGMTSDSVIDSDAQYLSSLPCFDGSIHHSSTVYARECEEKMIEASELKQKSEKEGFTILGNPIPNCQPDGNFAAVQLQGNRKICADPSGKQIRNYGLPITSPTAANMDCSCARTQLLVPRVACCVDGSWRAVQCRAGSCYCVSGQGTQQGPEVDAQHVQQLPCYSQAWQTC